MRFAATLLLASASVAIAQTATAASPRSTDKCDAQNIVDACKASIELQIKACKPNDWICMCDQYVNLLTCFNNCPNSPDRSPVANQVTSYCQAAAPLSSASLASASAAAATAAKAPATSSMATSAATTGSQTSAPTGTAVQAFSPTGAAAALNLVPLGGAAAVLFGLVGVL